MTATERLLSSHHARHEPLRVLAASGQLGYGIPEPALQRGLARRPHLIGCDMGSIDPGPYYLGSGEMGAPEAMVWRDLELVLLAALELGIPLVIGSAGTAGARPHLDATVAMVHAIAQARGLRFRLTTVASDIDPDLVVQALQADRLQPIGPMPRPSEAEIRGCSHIVGQCGTETLARALREPTDVLIAGRACDTAVFAALPEMLGYPVGLCQHMAKIIECTSLCCQPSGRDAMLAELDMDGFTLESMNPLAHATPASVAAHALYEQADPFEVEEPTGTLLLQQARYRALDPHRTRVSGAQWRPRAQPTLKLEGAARVGERFLMLAGVADPTLLASLDDTLRAVEARVRPLVPGPWRLHPHVYGQGAIRPLPPTQRSAHEAGLVLEFIADTAALARTAAGVYKQNLLHHGFPGRLCSAGNLAFPFTPSELNAGSAYRFVVYHVMQAAPLTDIFRIASCRVGDPLPASAP